MKVSSFILLHFNGKFEAVYKGRKVELEETFESINYVKTDTLLFVGGSLSFDEKVWIRFDKDKKTNREISERNI